MWDLNFCCGPDVIFFMKRSKVLGEGEAEGSVWYYATWGLVQCEGEEARDVCQG